MCRCAHRCAGAILPHVHISRTITQSCILCNITTTVLLLFCNNNGHCHRHQQQQQRQRHKTALSIRRVRDESTLSFGVLVSVCMPCSCRACVFVCVARVRIIHERRRRCCEIPLPNAHACTRCANALCVGRRREVVCVVLGPC